MDDTPSTQDLEARALRLLARREHSRGELARKLAPHAPSEATLVDLLDRLSERALLSDARYAEARLHSRGQRYGNQRLSQELRQQGVSAETIADALTGLEDELARCREVWSRKFGNLPGDIQERARQARFLAGRGFGRETIGKVLKGLPDDE